MNADQIKEQLETLLYQSARNFYVMSQLADVNLQSMYLNTAVLIYNKMLFLYDKGKVDVLWKDAWKHEDNGIYETV